MYNLQLIFCHTQTLDYIAPFHSYAIMPFHTLFLFLYYPTTYLENDDIKGKEKKEQHIVPFPSNFSFSISMSEVLLIVCTYQEEKEKYLALCYVVFPLF